MQATIAESQSHTSREPPNTPIRLLVVDDHAVLREVLTAALAAEPDIEVVGQASDGRTAVEMARILGPDVVLMDVTMPEMNGIAATHHITVAVPEVRVIVLSHHREELLGWSMHDAGAVLFINKSACFDDLVAAIRSVRFR